MKNGNVKYKKALECIAKTGRASTAHFQRWMGVGYKTASELMDMLESHGAIGPLQKDGGRDVCVERVMEELGSAEVAESVRKLTDEYQVLAEKVNALSSATTEVAYKLIEETVNSRKDLHRALVRKFGKPIRVMFKIERRRSDDVVVGGELQFRGTDIREGLIVGDDAVNVNGKECGGSRWSFGSCDEQLSKAIVEMFVKLYRNSRSATSANFTSSKATSTRR